MSKRWVFLDLETTGLDTTRAEVLELGMVIVDSDTLTVYASKSWLMWPGLGAYWERGAYNLHVETGFIDVLMKSDYEGRTTNRDRLISEAMDFVIENGAKDSPMCGSTIGSFDRPIVRREFPLLDNLFSYRCIDVSSVKELVKKWAPSLYDALGEYRKERGTPTKAHRAIPDCLESISELDFYRKKLNWKYEPSSVDKAVMEAASVILDPNVRF